MKLLEKIAIIFFDILDKYIHQKNILKYLKHHLENLKVFIDIGSHKGSYTDLIINNFEVKKIVMVEPQKNIFEYIKKKYFKDKRIRTYNLAISDKKKIQALYINDLIQNKYMVNSCKLSEIIKKNNIKKVDLLKIDTEGHELQVLKGAGAFLKEKVNFMLIEIHNSNIFLNYDAKKIHNYLKKNNFILKKKYKFPFTTWEDRIYQNKNFS